LFFIENYIGKRGRDEDHCIIVEHGALMEYERNIFDFWKAFFYVFIILSLLDFNFEIGSK
jgi:hypothetical protein